MVEPLTYSSVLTGANDTELKVLRSKQSFGLVIQEMSASPPPPHNNIRIPLRVCREGFLCYRKWAVKKTFLTY